MNNKLKPALLGGGLIGVLSVIPVIGACCCLWAILGGGLASYLYIKNSPTPVQTGDGAIVGALAGVVGGLIFLVIGIPIGILIGPAVANMTAEMLRNLDPSIAGQFRLQAAGQSIFVAIIKSFFIAILLTVLSAVGGLIAVAIFEKRK